MNESQSFLKTSQKISLSWKDLSLIDKKTGKYVLNRLSGDVSSGQFLTIMGPSGAGKSSFLSMITAKTSSYTSTFTFQGQATLNGLKYTQDQFISIASYVPQDDLLMETLTVQQTFAFQANLKLSDLSQMQRAERVKQVLMKLNLYQIRNSKVGGRQTKSISGGQKKRVAIGVELISNPMILVLDQPTSGLDSFNSLKIINLLSKLAKQQNKLIIATIHQPSTLMFQKFDRLMVLKNGEEVFNDSASQMVQYLQKLGVQVDYRMNPADFFMLELSQFKEEQGYKTPMTLWAWENSNKHKHEQQVNINATLMEQEEQNIDFNMHPPTTLYHQFKPLLQRSFKSFIRTPTNQFGKLMQLIWYPLLIGVMFWDIIDRFPSDLQDLDKLGSFLREFTGFLYLGMFFTVTIPLYDMILVFPIEKELVLKQVKSRMYSLELYYAIKLLIEVPPVLIMTWITTTIVFFIVGLQATFSNWFIYGNYRLSVKELAFSIIACIGYLIGVIMGVLAKQPHYAVQAAPFIVTIMNLYGGCIVNLKAIPAYSGWIQYISPLSYGYSVLMISQLDTDKLDNLGQYDLLLDYLGISGSVNKNLGGLCILMTGTFLLSFLVLYLRRKFY